MAANRWLDEDDIAPVTKGTNRWGDDDPEDFDPNKDYFQQVVQRRQGNMVESTQRSLAMLAESETVGAATGEELVRQGEVLRRTEKRVDKMESDLKESDRHLRSIKSIWGAFMNKFSKEPPPPKPSTYEVETDSKKKSNLQNVIGQCDNAMDERRQTSGHPVLDRQDESRQMYSGGVQEEAPQNSAMQQVENNLDLMGQSLARLKNLGLEMQNEIDDQDPIIERLQGKVNKVDDKLHATNKQMIKLNNS